MNSSPIASLQKDDVFETSSERNVCFKYLLWIVSFPIETKSIFLIFLFSFLAYVCLMLHVCVFVYAFISKWIFSNPQKSCTRVHFIKQNHIKNKWISSLFFKQQHGLNEFSENFESKNILGNIRNECRYTNMMVVRPRQANTSEWKVNFPMWKHRLESHCRKLTFNRKVTTDPIKNMFKIISKQN